MPARFCPACGSPNELSADFCSACGGPLSPPGPQAPAPPPESHDAGGSSPPPSEPGTGRPNRRTRSTLALLIAVFVVAILLILVFALPGTRTLIAPGGNPGHPPPVEGHTRTLVRAENRTLDPGPLNASVTPFLVPVGANASSVRGNLTLGACLPAVNLCLASVAILTAQNWSKFLAGGGLSAIWCGPAVPIACPAQAHLAFTTPSLDGYEGESLDFVVWSVGVLPETGCSWDAELAYTTS